MGSSLIEHWGDGALSVAGRAVATVGQEAAGVVGLQPSCLKPLALGRGTDLPSAQLVLAGAVSVGRRAYRAERVHAAWAEGLSTAHGWAAAIPRALGGPLIKHPFSFFFLCHATANVLSAQPGSWLSGVDCRPPASESWPWPLTVPIPSCPAACRWPLSGPR